MNPPEITPADVASEFLPSSAHVVSPVAYMAHSDSIRAPLVPKPARNEWTPVPLSQLGPEVPPEWIWLGFVAKGHISLLTGLWKAGKSTLLAHLLQGLERGDGLVVGSTGTRTLIVTEEGPTLWTRRREELGLTDAVHVIVRPFKGRPSWGEWEQFIGHLAGQVRSEGFGLVIMDPLPNTWPVRDENDASEVGSALMPLRTISDAGAALLIVHHPRKGGGDQGQASRGSGALPGFADIIVELRRFAPEEKGDRRRVLTCFSRFEESAPETVIELGDDEYKVIGDRAEVRQTDRLSMIDELLPVSPPGFTVEEVTEKWPTQPSPGRRTLALDLDAGWQAKRWTRNGVGRKGDPYRYHRPLGFDSRSSLALGARKESPDDTSNGSAAPVLPRSETA